MVISTLRIVRGPQSRAKVVRTLIAQLGPTRAQPACHQVWSLPRRRKDANGVTRSWLMA